MKHALVAGLPPPRSVMDLLSWADRPFGQWPWRLHVEGMDPGEVLLVDGEPSKACMEWALFNGDVEAEVAIHQGSAVV
jgi:restriction endonuclease in pPIWI_RE module